MADRLPPIGNADFWWLRYGLGIALPIVSLIYGIHSLVTGKSCLFGYSRYIRGLFHPVQGEPALWAGVGYIGLALALFATCYVQYHDKLYPLSPWFLAPGLVALVGGFGEATWYLMSH